MLKVAVTGGAGFIGSHLVDRLVREGNNVTVIDDLSGETAFLNKDADFAKIDICDKATLKSALKNFDMVYHLAAFPDIRKGLEEPMASIETNIHGTFSLLEAMRTNGLKSIIFASSSTVYGDASIPTDESAPTRPISIYGAAKLASESLISAYCTSFGMNGASLRLANVVGPRLTHGIIHDFYRKLEKDSKMLEVLGDGNQRKSYIFIDDCIEAFVMLGKRLNSYDVFNIGSEDTICAREIAEVAVDHISPGAAIQYTGGSRGWKSDVPVMLLDISKAKNIGWRPRFNSMQAVKKTVEWILQREPGVEKDGR